MNSEDELSINVNNFNTLRPINLKNKILYVEKLKLSNKKDKNEKTIFVFPQLNKTNEKLVEKYFNIISDKQSKKSNLSYIKVDDKTLKFPVSDESALRKILKKAGLSSKDYSLEKKEISENLRETIKKILNSYV